MFVLTRQSISKKTWKFFTYGTTKLMLHLLNTIFYGMDYLTGFPKQKVESLAPQNLISSKLTFFNGKMSDDCKFDPSSNGAVPSLSKQKMGLLFTMLKRRNVSSYCASFHNINS